MKILGRGMATMAVVWSVGCGSIDYDADLFGPTPVPLVTGAGGGPVLSTSSTGGRGGEGGAGGSGEGGASSTSTVASSTSTGACVPESGACGTSSCGTVVDSCGTTVQCGGCGQGKTCNAGSCCTPNLHACDRRCSTDVDDGCGGTVHCDPQCGPLGGGMTCGPGGVCACADAAFQPGAAQAWGACNPGGGLMFHPYYCGEMKTPDLPEFCSGPGSPIAPSNQQVWCCQ